ncbi:MAG: polymerase sigma-70 factor, subfamily, partial [Gaiellaceae bacterium]|nr:polymerase sigma-70 factor, subfamily [Gaiellaceae bacterium]
MALTMFPAGHASEDARLVRAARDGDKEAFASLYERYARMIHGILLARAPHADVEDLLQDVFLSAWNRLDALREPAAFGGWLAMIARNRATDFHRRTVESVELPENLAVADTSTSRTEALRVLQII